MAEPAQRHYGMDWLRIGAFALLILYHIGMVFVPWNFHVKSTHIAVWATLPMLATNAWRLTLLFVVSGYASRALLSRSATLAAFARNRTARLLVPLVFGMAVIVPPQPWIELVTKRGYRAPFLHFWWHDYFRFDTFGGIIVPTWNHLWFVAYLWVYTLVLVLLVLLVRGRHLQRAFDRAFAGWGVLAIPCLWYVAIHAWWFQMASDTQTLVDDWMGHLMYFPAFLFGFALARSEAAMRAIVRLWPAGLATALAGFAGVIAVELVWPGNTPAPRAIYPWYGTAHALQQWGAIVALIGIAERWWNHDRPIRATLTEAVFPFYIAHQTIIVVALFWLLPLALPGWAEFLILVATTVTGSAAFYLIGRRIAWLRPLIGLRRHLPKRRADPAPALA